MICFAWGSMSGRNPTALKKDHQSYLGFKGSDFVRGPNTSTIISFFPFLASFLAESPLCYPNRFSVLLFPEQALFGPSVRAVSSVDLAGTRRFSHTSLLSVSNSLEQDKD